MSSTYNGWKIRCIVTDGNGNNVTSNVATVKLVFRTVNNQAASVSKCSKRKAVYTEGGGRGNRTEI